MSNNHHKMSLSAPWRAPWHQLRQRLFDKVHGQKLIYNACWEDPRCDRALLDIQPGSHVVTITSAGCNAFDYLLDQPAALYCLDTNPRQNALMALKMAVFKEATFGDLEQLFAHGYHPKARELYQHLLRPGMPPDAVAYWDQQIGRFQDKQKRGSFYFYGMAGQFAWYFNQYLRSRPPLYRAAQRIVQANNLEEQAALYRQLEPHLLPGLVQWLLKRQVTLNMLGIPPAQRHLIRQSFPDGLAGYIKHCLRRIFTQTYLPHNYFWYLYMTGHYPEAHRPNYLLPANFETIRRQLSKIHLRNQSLIDFLKAEPGLYTHFILLDHQDWLAANQPETLAAEWALMAQHSAPEARTLMRSAAPEVHFLPDIAHRAFRFQQFKLGEEPYPDRVGTYLSTCIGFKHVKTPQPYGIC